MTLKIPTPRLLPATITMLAALFTLKCGILLQAAITHGPKPDAIIVAVANAASTERSPEQTPEPAKSPAAARKPAAPAPAASEGPPPVSASERVLLQDLRQRRKELDARAEAVATRESVLKATEQKLAARVTELKTLQKKLDGLDTARKQKQDAGWTGLVKLYEAMKPRDAATIFNNLEMPVMLQVFDRMKDAKAAAIMAAMKPDKARDVTAALAEMRTGQNASQLSSAASPPNPAGK